VYVKWEITVVFWTVWPLIEERRVQLTLCCMFVHSADRNTFVFSSYTERCSLVVKRYMTHHI